MSKKRYNTSIARSFSTIFDNKKGQVTIFIILGIIMLLAVVLVLIFQREIAITKPEEVVPLEKVSVESLVSACLEKIGTDALNLIGVQGGYVEIPADLNNANVHLRISPMHAIPYWAYGPNTNIPTLTQMEERIDVYIESNLRNCVLGVGAFDQSFNIIERSDIVSGTQIADAGVLFDVDWDIEIRDKAGDVVTQSITHNANSNVKLKRLQETAAKMVDAEMRKLKLEDITQDLISLEHPNVPVSGMEVSCNTKKWKITETKQSLKDLLRVNLRELRIGGTNFVNFPDTLPYYQNHYIWNIENDFTNKEVSVLFNFQDNFPFTFDVGPRAGTYLRSGQLGGDNPIISAFCLQTWKFSYDVEYPVQVIFTDDTTGFELNTALTVHLKNNLADRDDSVPGTPNIFLTSISDQEYCDEARIPMTIYTSELVENNNTGVYDKNPLDDVSLSLSCLQHGCDIGDSEFNFANLGNVAAYRTIFPFCVGGILRGQKEGYKDSWQRIVTEEDAEFELLLTPLFRFPSKNIKIVKHEFNGPEQIGIPQQLGEQDIALIGIKFGGVNLLTGERFHESDLVQTKLLDTKVIDESNLEFLAKADFTYELEIKVLDNDRFIGGYSGPWEVNWNQLQSANELVFHIASADSSSEQESFALLLGLEDASNYLPQPELK